MQDDTNQPSNQYQNPVDGQTYVAKGGWQDYQPQNPQPADPAQKVALDHIRLLTDQDTVSANLSTEQLSGYIKEVTAAIVSATNDITTPFQLMLQFELKPAEKVGLQIANQGDVNDNTLQKVYDNCLALGAPQPTSQAVAFQAMFKVNN